MRTSLIPGRQVRVQLLGLLVLVAAPLAAADEPQLIAPVAQQVIQRQGFDPRVAPLNDPEGDSRGWADVALIWTSPANATAGWQSRTVLLENAYGTAVDWTELTVSAADGKLHSSLRIPAGGWYRLELRHQAGTQTTKSLSVEPVGVGEVFLISGQSYAGGYNDEKLKVTEPERRVTAFHWREDRWIVCDDPVPHVGPEGTVWPALGDLLVPMLRTPVGFVNVSVGATSTSSWATDGPLFADMVTAGKKTGSFRAVLWQQGESDVIEGTSATEYDARLKVIRCTAMKTWGLDVPWLPAKSTLHPTVYHKPKEEEAIRSAIEELWSTPGFRPGPDTDALDGENRGGPMTMRHFSGIGQRRAALLWFVSIWTDLHRPAADDTKDK